MIKIVTDFEEELFLYKLPQNAEEQICKDTDAVKIQYLSEVLSDGCFDDIEIYWGHKPFFDTIVNFPNLKWIHLGTSGYDKLNLEYCRSKQIRVSKSSKENARAVVLTAISMLLNDLRGTSFNAVNAIKNQLEKEQIRKSFEVEYPYADTSSSIKVLVLGFGSIGIQLFESLKNLGFQCTAINSTSIFFSDGISRKFTKKTDLSSMVSEADYVINCLPSSPSTKHFVDAEFMGWMKKIAFYISVGRSATTDLESLINRIEVNSLRGAALDVYEDLRNPRFISLVLNRRIVVLPHVAGFYKSYWNSQINLFSSNLKKFLSNEELIDELSDF
jgi:phosphoglycerate dehydrogenase-like enzyme